MKQDVSERLTNIDICYQQTKLAIDNELKSKGYSIIADEYRPQVFGSRYTTWSYKKDAIRLIWDGKDGWFCLEEAHNSPFDWTVKWDTLIHVPYLKEHDLEYANNIPAKVLACLIDHVY